MSDPRMLSPAPNTRRAAASDDCGDSPARIGGHRDGNRRPAGEHHENASRHRRGIRVEFDETEFEPWSEGTKIAVLAHTREVLHRFPWSDANPYMAVLILKIVAEKKYNDGCQTGQYDPAWDLKAHGCFRPNRNGPALLEEPVILVALAKPTEWVARLGPP